MSKQDTYTDILHKMLKIHLDPKHKGLRFMQTVINTTGTEDQYYLSDEDLLNKLEDYYEDKTKEE